ncbi:MAG: leucine-rich repeat domain-containing protein [Blautia sp.]
MKRKFSYDLWMKMHKLDITYTKNKKGAKGLRRVEIPDKYIYIGNEVFHGVIKLRELRLPAHCKYIGRNAFRGCNLEKSLTFPESVEFLMSGCFAQNAYLRKVTFPIALKRMDGEVFRDCSRLHTVIFHRDCQMKVIREESFRECGNLRYLELPGGVKKIGRRAFYRCKQLEVLNLPSGLLSIEEEAFYFAGIKELMLPETLQVIGNSSFLNVTT